MTCYTPVRLAYVTNDPASGANADAAPVIFLHGTTATKECWGDIPQVIADAAKRKVYCLDSRNHGDSEWSDEFNFDMNSVDLVHFLDSQGIDRAVLIGHSMGGVTCMQTALKHPQRVECAFIVDMFAHRVPQRVLDAVAGLASAFEEAADALPPHCTEAAAQAAIQRRVATSGAITNAIFTIFTRSLKDRKSGAVPKWISRKQESSINKPRANSNIPLTKTKDGKFRLKLNSKVILEAMKTEDGCMSEPEGTYEGPIYFLYGTESPYNVNEDILIPKHFPNAKLIGIEGSGHNVHLDMPEELTQEILKQLL